MTEFSHNGDSDGEVLFSHEAAVDDSLPADCWEFVQVVHALVAAETEPGALGTAIGAFTHLSVRTERVDTHQLVDEFEGPSESYLTRRWGPLPGSTRIDSGTGRRLLKLALDRMREQADASDDAGGSDSTIPYLCTESGFGLGSRTDVIRYRRKMDETVWVVPAVTFQYLTGSIDD